jgi:hypothetical protein
MAEKFVIIVAQAENQLTSAGFFVVLFHGNFSPRATQRTSTLYHSSLVQITLQPALFR